MFIFLYNRILYILTHTLFYLNNRVVLIIWESIKKDKLIHIKIIRYNNCSYYHLFNK